jgi:hypothetical protein
MLSDGVNVEEMGGDVGSTGTSSLYWCSYYLEAFETTSEIASIAGDCSAASLSRFIA